MKGKVIFWYESYGKLHRSDWVRISNKEEAVGEVVEREKRVPESQWEERGGLIDVAVWW